MRPIALGCDNLLIQLKSLYYWSLPQGIGTREDLFDMSHIMNMKFHPSYHSPRKKKKKKVIEYYDKLISKSMLYNKNLDPHAL